MLKLLALTLVVIVASCFGAAAYATSVVDQYNNSSLTAKVKTGFYCHGDSPKTPQDKLDCFILAHSK